MALYYDTSPVGTTSAGGNTMNPLLLAVLLLGAGGRHERFHRFFELEHILMGPPLNLNQAQALQVIQEVQLVAGREGGLTRRRELLPLLLLLASQAPAQATTTAPTTTTTAAPAGLDPTALALTFALLAE